MQNKTVRILFAGDVVGRPARNFLKKLLPDIRVKENLDAIIVNGENAASGSSLTKDTARDIFYAGADVVTSGDHIFKRREVREVLETMDVLRPLNWGGNAFGKGYLVKKVGDYKIGVINLVGRVFMQPSDCPFNAVIAAIEEIKKETNIIVVDVHAEATSEKVAMGYFLSGKVSLVAGTHTHIPTADERIINGTGYITDVGMTGSFDSILGRDKAAIIEKFVTNIPVKFNLAEGDVRLQGVIVEVDEKTGAALSIRRVEYCQDKHNTQGG
jgi:metallophosphoesterase (TIGR00282 family)